MIIVYQNGKLFLRKSKWGTGAIERISERLQGKIPGLHGFSASNMKNMRIFFEQWASEL
jgi:hypothetical protein